MVCFFLSLLDPSPERGGIFDNERAARRLEHILSHRKQGAKAVRPTGQGEIGQGSGRLLSADSEQTPLRIHATARCPIAIAPDQHPQR
jgi:hypothetical protein